MNCETYKHVVVIHHHKVYCFSPLSSGCSFNLFLSIYIYMYIYIYIYIYIIRGLWSYVPLHWLKTGHRNLISG